MKRLVKWTVNIVLILVVLLAIFAFLLPIAFSTRLAIVRSASMEPAMLAGSLAVLTPVDPATIEIGDVIYYSPPWDPDILVSHRVVRFVEGESLRFVTKGDANEEPDPYVVPAEGVIGRVSWHTPYIGYALNEIRQFASSIWGFIVVIVLPAVIIFSGAVRDANFMYSPGKRRARLMKKREERLKRRAPRSWQLGRAR